jgi:hypothetical protein
MGAPRRPDPGQAGIYPEEDVDAMEKMQQQGWLMEAVTTTIMGVAEQNGWAGTSGQPLTIRDITPENWMGLEAILVFLGKWGQMISTIITLIILLLLTTWLLGLGLRILAGPSDPRRGPLAHVLTCLLPSLGPYLTYRADQEPPPSPRGLARRRKWSAMERISLKKRRRKKDGGADDTRYDEKKKEHDSGRDQRVPHFKYSTEPQVQFTGPRPRVAYSRRLHQGRLSQITEEALARQAENYANEIAARTT